MFDEDTSLALDSWLSRPTWIGLHGIDEDRFHAFVESAWRQFRGLWDEKGAREQVLAASRTHDPELNEEDRMRVIYTRMSQADAIMKFLTYQAEKA